MHDDCDNEWLYEDLEDDAMMDLLIGDIVGENDLQQSNISNNIKSQKSMRIIRKNTDGAYEIYDPPSVLSMIIMIIQFIKEYMD